MIGERTVDSFPATMLVAPDAGVEAMFVPGAGMVGCSLRHRGEELLGQRGGLATYVAERSTMGIPLLHPWANRLGRSRFRVAGGQVDLDAADPAPAPDPNGLPIHGLLAAADGWKVRRRESTEEGGTLAASFDFGAESGLVAAFPFPHEIVLEVTLEGPALTLRTEVHAAGEAAVPISFGYHPYFRLPGLDRARWEVEIPVTERLRLDDLMLPIGEREEVAVEDGPLGSRTFDDAYGAPEAFAPFVLAGAGRRIEISFGPGYPFAQVYAPADDEVVAIEPMTAPTNALVNGGPELPLCPPGESYEATFSISITDAPS